jgi:type IV pilus assembly protein PilP
MRRIRGHNSPGKVPVKSAVMLFAILIVAPYLFFGCSNQPAPPPARVTPQAKSPAPVPQAAAPQPSEEGMEASQQEGYIYQRRDRRDPFVPLVVPKKEASKGVKAGTLTSYDLSEFTLAAIAKRGKQYFALLTTPDNRSFTVTKGTRIGMNKGKVKDISKNKVTLVEYTRDYSGQLKPREILLEFHKGEVE